MMWKIFTTNGGTDFTKAFARTNIFVSDTYDPGESYPLGM